MLVSAPPRPAALIPPTSRQSLPPEVNDSRTSTTLQKMPISRENSFADVDFTLRSVFKKRSFRYDRTFKMSTRLLTFQSRPLQREVIIAALNGDDVFLQAATSFGKSICFQLPALIDHGSGCTLNYCRNFFSNFNKLLSSSPHCFLLWYCKLLRRSVHWLIVF